MTDPAPNEPQGTVARLLVPVVWVGSVVLAQPVAILFFYPDDWSLTRRIFAGLLLGVGTALILTANRLIGPSESI